MATKTDRPVKAQNGRLSASSSNGQAKYRAQRDLDRLRTDKAIMARFKGHTQSEAYAIAFRTKGNGDVDRGQACKWFGKPAVVNRQRELTASLRASDLDSDAEVLQDLREGSRICLEDRNMSGLGTLTRTRAQIRGLVQDNRHIVVEHTLTDVELIGSITDGDATLALGLRAKLGTDHSFD